MPIIGAKVFVSKIAERDEWWSHHRQNTLNIITTLCKNSQTSFSSPTKCPFNPQCLAGSKTLSGLKIICHKHKAISINTSVYLHCTDVIVLSQETVAKCYCTAGSTLSSTFSTENSHLISYSMVKIWNAMQYFTHFVFPFFKQWIVYLRMSEKSHKMPHKQNAGTATAII